MFGILNINKASGWTSRDAVNRVQKFVRPSKVGHAGTLDPLASGVLVVCVGPATRLIDYVQQSDKEYIATFLLGRKSASDDIETEVSELPDQDPPELEAIQAEIPRFTGMIDQVPPAYSAVKIAGQRAYALARRGQEVIITARPVEVHEIEILDYQYPRLQLRIRCGSGTYVRSLGRDLAASLGTAAVMSELVRTRIGTFLIENSISVDGLCTDVIQSNTLAPAEAVRHLPSVIVSEHDLGELRFGRNISGDCASECAAFDERENLVAILRPKAPGVLKPHINFASPA